MTAIPKPTWLFDYQQRIEKRLTEYLPAPTSEPTTLHKAMHYATLNGGKRIRPVLVYATGNAFGIAIKNLDAAAAAIEFIHAYSLVHDDLPAMDNDALRRGKPTCHIAFDEATAMLVGDALQTLAFSTLLEQSQGKIKAESLVSMTKVLAQASGVAGMAGGQAIDLASVGQPLSVKQLENMHLKKTGALIRASVHMAALTKFDEQNEVIALLNDFANNMGLAFQIQDDILDIEGDTQTLGKTQGADVALNKPTYPALMGLSEAKKRANYLHQKALENLVSIDQIDTNYDTTQLAWIADFIILRNN